MESIRQNIVLRNVLISTLIFGLLAGWLWLLCFNTINSPFERDEGEYAYSARLLKEGGSPYKESFMQKPPMIIYVYYLAQTVSKDVWAPRILALLSLILTALILGDLARRTHGKKAALAVLILFPAILFFRSIQAFSAQPEVFLLLPLVTSWWCYLRSEKNPNKKLWWLAAIGSCSAIALLYKPIVLPAVVFLFVYIFIKTLRHEKFTRAVIEISTLGLGAILTTLIILWPITARGGLAQMWDSAFLYNMHYASVVGFAPPFGLKILFCTWPLLGLLIWYLFKIKKYKFLFLGLFGGLILGTAGSFMAHYYIIVVPALSLISTIALADLADSFCQKKSTTNSFIFVFVFTILISALLILPEVYRFSLTPSEMLDDLYLMPEFEAAPVVASTIQKITAPQDTVFIDGSEPEILYYAHRKSATRFVIKYPLILPTIFSERYKAQEISELQSNPPKIIVSYSTPLNLNNNLKKLKNLDILDQYLVSLLLKDYTFMAVVSLMDENNQFKVTYSTEQPKLDGVQYLVIYKRKSDK
jgi:hypothetical protein